MLERQGGLMGKAWALTPNRPGSHRPLSLAKYVIWGNLVAEQCPCKGAHILICESVTLHGEVDFANVIKVMDF